jgi:hypothetical protein
LGQAEEANGVQAAEIKRLQDRCVQAQRAVEEEKGFSDTAQSKLDMNQKRLRNIIVTDEELLQAKDERIKALMEENVNLATTIEKFINRAVNAHYPESDYINKQVATIESICLEMKKDTRVVDRFETAFHGLEEKLRNQKNEIVDLKMLNDESANRLKSSVRENQVLAGQLIEARKLLNEKEIVMSHK